MYLNSKGNNYTKAVNILWERFGGEGVVADAYMKSKADVQANKQSPKEQEGKRQICHYCTKNHDLDNCTEFTKLDGIRDVGGPVDAG
ncbi:hypothetical protein E2C01_009249 [Portunus trituberculatus]|uniref:Uncharacterized protein n=1 Tax=Portunus trituberculatus TaxID=210409 RepID=A0A5B7D4U6_PORTR|nr:hypothetical protein [Portunus trituberculatus]